MKRARSTTGSSEGPKRKKRKTAQQKAAEAPLELKGIDNIYTDNAIEAVNTGNGSARLISGVQVGAEEWNRIGKTIHVKSLQVRAHFAHAYTYENTPDFASFGNKVRIIIVRDMKPSVSLPDISTIVASLDETGTETCDRMVSMPNMKYTKRLRILRDEVIEMPVSARSAPGSPIESIVNYYTYQTFIDMKGDRMDFDDTNNPIVLSDVVNPAYYIYLRSLLNETYSIVSATVCSRMRYYD